MNDDERLKAAIELRDSPFFPHGVETMKRYFRTHDDCDGKMGEGSTP